MFLANIYAFGQLAEIENKITKNVPLDVEVKNFDSENWVYDLEIKVTNTGKKPIYYLYLSFTLDEQLNGGPVGFLLQYGAGQLYTTNVLARPLEEDVPILPNESYTFKLNKNSADARMNRKARENFTDPQKAFVELGWLSYGDGTGFANPGVPFPFKKKIPK
jgi:hypothetical protein